ncbi:hemin transport system permease protein HmuU [Ruminiclostridium hungatei]|uniref:Hemin transport system permease protein HmuU n=1 Tax=Ruminiclostridium hungatei TaxID=48256 RepID=A0A1V4SK00_RUMHU|nr:iron ABC transporter permease [Ruminiclostridium hungatei]OPX43765.1 hemin transport system permease protein HmuU [Ruminiclostridium hungatei]
MKKADFKIGIIPVMLMVLLVITIAGTAVGAVYVPFFDTFRIILKNLGLLKNAVFAEGQEPIIFLVRFPRVAVAALAGTALGASGAVMQGMFRNPMADPGILGISSGAGLGAVLAIKLGLAAVSMYYMPLFAFTGAFLAIMAIYLLSYQKGKVPVLTLILSGIAISTFLGAITNIILTISYDYQVKEFLFWSTGGLEGRRWEHFRLIVLPVFISVVLMCIFSRDLNVLLMGEEEAKSVGLNTGRLRTVLLILVSAATASAVCVTGSISFVGLIVPHIMRLLIGPDHKILLPASAIGGAIFLVGCDLISRVVAVPYELGVGIITALLGAPYFLYLLLKSKRAGGAVI